MSLHTKTLATLAALSCFAVTGMVTIATNPDWTPTYAVHLAPIAVCLMGAAVVSYALDLISGRA